MFLASLFLAALARSLANPIPTAAPSSAIPSPLWAIAAPVTACECDPSHIRTTYDIVWSCMGVILLCTYISIHDNIPDQEDSWLKVTWTKIKTTLLALLAPEMVIMWAIRQRIMASVIAEKNKDLGWTKAHGFFVQMGGLVRREGESTWKVICDQDQLEGIEIPRIPEKEIQDRGKRDALSKTIVVIQTTWFVAQCIARAAHHLVLTELELVTLAFATLNLITYWVWWDKPLNVGYPIYFDEAGNRVDGPEAKESTGSWYRGIMQKVKNFFLGERADIRQKGLVRAASVRMIKAPFVIIFLPLAHMLGEEGERNRPTSVHAYYAAKQENAWLAVLYGSLIGVLFGALHLIAWDFRFSTLWERWLWRSSSLVLVGIPLSLSIGSAFFIAKNKTRNIAMKEISQQAGFLFVVVVGMVFSPAYFIARIAIIFQAFFALHTLPDEAYQNVKWTEFAPHI